MKKLLLLLLFIPLVSFGQSQIVNGIEVSAPKEYVKTGNLTWSKGNNTFIVQSFDIKLNPDEIAKSTYPDLKFLRTDEFDLNGKKYKIGFNSANNGSQLIGMMAIVKGNYSFLIAATVFSNEFKGTAKEKVTAMIAEIFYLMSYSAGKLDFIKTSSKSIHSKKILSWQKVVLKNKKELNNNDPFARTTETDSSYAYVYGKMKPINNSSILPKLTVHKDINEYRKGNIVLSIPLKIERTEFNFPKSRSKEYSLKFQNLLKKDYNKVVKYLEKRMENAYDDNLLGYAVRKAVESIRGKREFIIKITFDKDKNIYTKRISLSDTNISFGEQWGKYRSDDELPDFVELKMDKDWEILSAMKSNNKMYIKFSYNLYERFAVSYRDSDGWEERSLFAGFDYIIKNYNPDSYYEFSLSGSSKALDFN